MDNRKLSPVALEYLRKRAVESVIKHGLTQIKACKVFGFSETSMCKYIKEYKEEKEASYKYKKPGVKGGTGSKMESARIDELVTKLLTHTPDELGLNYTLWTSKAVHEYIESNYSVTYNRRSIRKILTKLGFTSQKPIKLAYQRNPKKIEAWLTEIYPKIKTRAMQEGARIYWGDEMGIQSTDNRGKTYGLKGRTPVIKKTGSRFKCNMLAAISPQGFMNWMVFEDNFTSKKCIEFLGRMIRQIKQKVFLILDNHRVHHSKKVKAYVEKHKDKLELFYLPPYCPDMNPQELVNQDVKANSNNFRTLKSVNDLTINLRYYLTKIQFDQFKIINYFSKKEVAYAAC
jgi:transposase